MNKPYREKLNGHRAIYTNIQWGKSFKPDITVSEIKEFIMNRDKDRQAWLETAPMMEILDWIVPALSED